MATKALTVAIEKEQWDVAALLLVHALLRIAYLLPPNSVQGLLEALEGVDYAQPGH